MAGSGVLTFWHLFLFTLFATWIMFLFVVGYLSYVHHRYSHIPGPPRSSFFFGHIPQIREMHKKGVYTHHLFLKWAEEYGPLYKIFLFHKCMLIPTSPTFLEEVLTKSQYRKASMVYSRLHNTCGQRFLGNGFVTNIDHQSWSKRRAAVEPAFHRKFLKGLMQQFNDIADLWIAKLEVLADGKTPFSMADFMYRVTLDVIGKVGFNMDIEAVLDHTSPLPVSLNRILEGFSAQLRDPLLQLRPGRRAFVREVQEAAVYLRGEARRTLLQRVDALNAGQDAPLDILSFLIRSAVADPSLSIEDLIDDFMTIFIAGQETTSNILCFLFNEIGRHPHVFERLQEEVDRVLHGESVVSYEDTSRLEYLHQVWKETLRLYPPAPGTARENTEDCCIDGYFIPKNSFITVSFFVNHRLASNFPDPTVFDPERFDSNARSPKFAYMPFSLGPRACAGQQFSQIEAKVLICKFLQKFTFRLEPDQSFEVNETTTLRPKGGTVLTLSRR